MMILGCRLNNNWSQSKFKRKRDLREYFGNSKGYTINYYIKL